VLSDSTSFPEALFALSRIEHPDATTALLTQLKTASDQQISEIIHVLGEKPAQLNGSSSLVTVLRKYTTHQQPNIRIAAYTTLAKLADSKSAATILKATERADGLEQLAARQCALRLAENLLVQQKYTTASTIYTHLLAQTIEPGECRSTQEKICLAGLGKCGNSQAIKPILTHLPTSDKKLQTAIQSALVTLPDPKVTRNLISLYQSTQESQTKAVLLEAICKRDRATAASLLPRAIQSSDTVVKATGYSLLYLIDSPKVRRQLKDLIFNKTTTKKQSKCSLAALFSMLQIGESLQQQNQPEAVKFYLPVLLNSTNQEDLQAALAGIQKLPTET